GVDVPSLREGAHQLGVAADVRHDPQLDLAIISGEQLHARRGDEGGADLASYFGAYRDVLQVRVAAREPAGGRDRLVQMRVDAPIARVDQVLQRVRVSGLQLRQLPPLQDERRQGVL